MNPKHFIIPVFIPELACPFQCIYCDQRKISGKINIPSENDVVETLITHLETIPSGMHIELGFFGGNFTGIPATDQEKYLKIAQPFLSNGSIQSIRLSTRPDYINQEILDVLKKYKVGTIELGAQSMDDEVLKKSKRGHTVSDTLQAAKMIRDSGFMLGLQMMIGLPGDSKEKAIYTARKIIEEKAENTRIYPTLIIKGTKLEQLFMEGKYQPLTIEEAIDWSADILEIFEKSSVKILRVGLHPSEGLLDGSDLVAGPFHPSFRELLLTEIWYKKLRNINCIGDHLNIAVNPKELNYAIGYESKNKKWLKTKFKKVHFITNTVLTNRNYEAHCY